MVDVNALHLDPYTAHITKLYTTPSHYNSGHEFSEGQNVIRGRSCPWNTFALWIVDSLSLTGFPPVGDGHGPQRELGGVEVTSLLAIT